MTDSTPPTDPTTLRVATVKEVAELLKVSEWVIYRMAQTGEIPVLFHVGPRLRFDLDAVIDSLVDKEAARRPAKAP